jgi:Omp85 superfamily domain
MSSQKNTIIMSKLFINFLFLLVIIPSGLLLADIPEIIVKGNEKTDTEYITQTALKCLQHQIPDLSSDIDSSKLKECLFNTKLFSDVSVEQFENKYTITIDERWSLIPIPIITTESGGKTSYGLFIIESNFLGLGKTLALGGSISEENSLLFMMYEDKAVFNSDWRFKTTVGQQQNRVYLYDGRDKIDGLDEKASFYNFSLGYAFLPGFSIDLGFGYNTVEFKSFETYSKPEDYSAKNLNLSAKWSDTKFKFYYQEGVSMDFNLVRQIDRSDEKDLLALSSFKADWQTCFFSNHAFQFSYRMAGSDNPERESAMRIGSKKGSRGIPDNGVWAESIASISLDYQIPVMSGSSGTWTVAPFLDKGIIKIVDRQDRLVHYRAMGIGSYFFLKQIAIPGMGFVIGSNDTYEETFYKFTVGFDF